jgi:hypothetical protein
MKYRNYICIPNPFCGTNKITSRNIDLLIGMGIWDLRVYQELKIIPTATITMFIIIIIIIIITVKNRMYRFVIKMNVKN